MFYEIGFPRRPLLGSSLKEVTPRGGSGSSIKLGYFPDKSIEKAADKSFSRDSAALVNLTI
jgi:hypothetical protein